MKKTIVVVFGFTLLVELSATPIPIVRDLYHNDATALNQGRHLDRTPNTSILYVVYHQKQDSSPTLPAGDVAWFARSTNGGATWPSGERHPIFWRYIIRDTLGNPIYIFYLNSAFPSITANDPHGGAGGVALLGLVDTTNPFLFWAH